MTAVNILTQPFPVPAPCFVVRPRPCDSAEANSYRLAVLHRKGVYTCIKIV